MAKIPPFAGRWMTLEIGNWKLEIGNWKLGIGNWKPEIRAASFQFLVSALWR